MNLLSPFAALTTAKCIAPLTNMVGGDRRELMRSPQRKSYGARRIRSRTRPAANDSRDLPSSFGISIHLPADLFCLA